MSSISIGKLADAIMEELNDYVDLTSDGVKAAVTKAAKTVRTEIQAGAPVKSDTYKKSRSTKTTSESSQSLEITVYSHNRYQLAHLLEFGHVKRGGGRVSARPHIADVEQPGIEHLEREIERCICIR